MPNMNGIDAVFQKLLSGHQILMTDRGNTFKYHCLYCDILVIDMCKMYNIIHPLYVYLDVAFYLYTGAVSRLTTSPNVDKK